MATAQNNASHGRTMSGLCPSPILAESQLRFRIGLARKRTTAYPLDSMDFIMLDLERPEMSRRFADWCTGDLTGRLLEFLSCAQGIDGCFDERLPALFERILKQRRPSGLFGRYSGQNNVPEDDPLSGCSRLLPGLIRYYEFADDSRALEAAAGMADWTIKVKDAWRAKTDDIAKWITEPFARLYGITGDRRYLEFCAFINESCLPMDCRHGRHTHGFLSTLRGLQLMAHYTGDAAWNEKPEYYRHLLIDRHYAKADGCVTEVILPNNFRNEGCAIADWLMLNLNAGNDSAYEQAEHILWNALYFNQFVSGGFGHHDLTPSGYSIGGFEEAWWCCLHHCGMAMTEYARHVVTCREHAICVNFLVPGCYNLLAAGQPDLRVIISTDYPASASAIIEVTPAPPGTTVHVRIPGAVHGARLEEQREGDRLRLTLSGRMGHRLLPCEEGVILTYGPLVLAPMGYYWDADRRSGESSVPAGYIPPSLPAGIPELICEDKDAGGFLILPNTPRPDWAWFDEGPGARLAVGQAAVNVRVRFPAGKEHLLRFWPLCYATSNLIGYETPIIFKKSK